MAFPYYLVDSDVAKLKAFREALDHLIATAEADNEAFDMGMSATGRFLADATANYERSVVKPGTATLLTEAEQGDQPQLDAALAAFLAQQQDDYQAFESNKRKLYSAWEAMLQSFEEFAHESLRSVPAWRSFRFPRA